jgi:hypothetical protein
MVPRTHPDPELMGSVARHWTLAPYLGRRTQAIFGAQFPRALTLNDANGCAGCEPWTSRQFGGINTAFVYQWREGKAFSPYLLTGAEALVTHSRPRFDAPCAATSSCAFVDPYLVTQSTNEATLGLTAGAGLALKFGRRTGSSNTRHTRCQIVGARSPRSASVFVFRSSCSKDSPCGACVMFRRRGLADRSVTALDPLAHDTRPSTNRPGQPPG